VSTDQLSWEHDARGLKFAIVVARFNSFITEKLLAGAKEALEKAGAEGFEIFYVPGAFELPLASKLLAHTHAFNAVIALGAVIRGDTPHFDFVANECARGLQQVALETGLPVAFGVLTTDNIEQAEARADKGFDTAMTAIEMVRVARVIALSGAKAARI
jgi:6,7-dimethyl-8-ribityllumazine synthase